MHTFRISQILAALAIMVEHVKADKSSIFRIGDVAYFANEPSSVVSQLIENIHPLALSFHRATSVLTLC